MSHPILFGNPYYLVLSLIIMCYASYTMLNMIEQPGAGWKIYGFNWLVGGAAVFGLGLWTMHVVSLLASDHRIVMDWSMLLVLGGSGIIIYAALLVVTKGGPAAGSLFSGAMLVAVGATLLHYMSMLNDSVTMLHMNWALYALSFMVSFAGAYAAFYVIERKYSRFKLKSCLLLGFSSMLMHQLGMHALDIEYRDIFTADQLNNYLLLFAFLLGVSTLIILSFSLTTHFAAGRYRQINERYKLLVENSMDTIALVGKGKWEFMNRAGLRMFGAQHEREILGTCLFKLLDEKHHAEMQHWLMEKPAGDDMTPGPIELQWQTLQGKPLYTEIVRASATFSGKQIEQIIIRDISERKKNEELLINSEKLYVAGQLAAGIAHEIRNPLTSLKGFLQLMSTGRGSSEHFYEIMKSELIRIESIVSELLMLSKPQVYDFSRKDACRIMADTVNLLDTQAILHSVTLDFRSDSRPLWVMGVENQLKQVFINVLKNAIESMSGGGTVSIGMELEAGTVVIRIKDEGSGISKEQLASLGQPFYTTKDKGTGLGLMVTYKIIDNHQGQITAESEMGVGTTFVIRLPYAGEQE
ncbi:PAS domain S-box protein [Paenibacillus sp. N4]|uniref:ATP-binding protein n=1 Tax=Paenibacillus vietnamensis TaxID=2590547 RepID=UPI001CD0E6C6|nr:ATP-binding protein [Paenibacillus vietnamensis]MCA0756421.1 PAS domain S-box protein [Paenibacillus vietnamensis]